jgi:hypothetical protein
MTMVMVRRILFKRSPRVVNLAFHEFFERWDYLPKEPL